MGLAVHLAFQRGKAPQTDCLFALATLEAAFVVHFPVGFKLLHNLDLVGEKKRNECGGERGR